MDISQGVDKTGAGMSGDNPTSSMDDSDIQKITLIISMWNKENNEDFL